MVYHGSLGKRSQRLIDYFQAIPGVPKLAEGLNPGAHTAPHTRQKGFKSDVIGARTTQEGLKSRCAHSALAVEPTGHVLTGAAGVSHSSGVAL